VVLPHPAKAVETAMVWAMAEKAIGLFMRTTFLC
jgi:hypothetical protein